MKYWIWIVLVILVAAAGTTAAAQTSPATPSVVPSASVMATPSPTTPPASPNTLPSPSVTAPTPTPPVLVPVLPPAGALPAPTSTGIEVVDRVLSVIAAGNFDDVNSQIQYVTLPCGNPNPVGDVPCPAGQPAGTQVSGFWTIGCRGFFITGSDAVASMVRGFLTNRRSLWAVTVHSDPALAGVLYEAFYVPQFSVLIDGEGIAGFRGPCFSDSPPTISDFITQTVGSNPTYVIAPGGAPNPPATGSSKASASSDRVPMLALGMGAIGAAVLLLRVAVALRRRV